MKVEPLCLKDGRGQRQPRESLTTSNEWILLFVIVACIAICISDSHGDGASQWEHPDISEVVVRMGRFVVLGQIIPNLFVDLDGMNEIKFAAYRTAMKLRTVQKVTHCKWYLL